MFVGNEGGMGCGGRKGDEGRGGGGGSLGMLIRISLTSYVM